MLKNWHPEVRELLDNQNYQALADYYEGLVENEHDEISNYWYLGLAYLLAGQEESAQLTWFMVLNQWENELELEIKTKELTEILGQEADRQEQINNQNISLLIREKIWENNPQRLDNIIQILLLKSRLNLFNIQLVEELKLLEIIDINSLSEYEINLLINLSKIILDVPNPITIHFVKKVYFLLKDYQEFTEILNEKIELRTNHLNRFYIYGAELYKIVLEYDENNLLIINKIFWFYYFNRSYDQAKAMALQYLQKSSTIIEKFFASYQLLLNTIFSSDWFNIQEYSLLYQESLISLQNEQPEKVEKYIANWLSTFGQLLFYLEDNPRKNRQLINNLGRLSQIQSNRYYRCESEFSSSLNLSPSRKLKVGYIGSTLRSHSVGLLSRWLIQHHNRDLFSIYTYFVCQDEDAITKKFFKNSLDQAYHGNNVIQDFVGQIKQDEIDILVDLDSFTHNVTGVVMALKPAPIQISWLGMDSYGLPTIDYFIADPYVLPDNAQDYYEEKIWRLPHTYLGVDGFEVNTPNLHRENLEIAEDAIVFLNVQNALKRNPHTIHLQMKIIKAIPNSYLLIKGNGDEQITQNFFESIAETEGVNPNQLRFLPRTPGEAIHRANIKIADVVLDTYPYNGSTTTLETLWMEVPIVTRVGEQFAARNSYTYMMNAGITEGIAWSDEEYIEWGIKLGTDENLRKEISWKLKQSKKTSPLWNGKQFARDMENAYRQMWEIYVKENS